MQMTSYLRIPMHLVVILGKALQYGHRQDIHTAYNIYTYYMNAWAFCNIK